MSDTITALISVIQANQDQTLNVIQKVDDFYNNAWTKLMIIITLGFTIVGIIVPLFIQWLQKKSLKSSEDLLKKEISDKTREIKSEISTEILKQIDSRFAGYENKIKILNASANAKISLTQGKLHLEKGYFDAAFISFITSSHSCLDCDDYQNIQIALNLILNECLPNLSMEEINNMKNVNDTDLDLLLTRLKENDNKGIFTTITQEIQLKRVNIPKTIKEKPQERPKS